jgi:hypothetical protein
LHALRQVTKRGAQPRAAAWFLYQKINQQK